MAKAATKKINTLSGNKSLLFALLGLVFAVFSNTLLNDYCMDDEIVTMNHPLTSQGISAIPQILKSPYFKADIYSYEYRPVVHISFAIEHQFFGESPGVSHFINVLLYLTLVFVSFHLLKQLFPAVNDIVHGIIILIFSLHPTHTEVVASIKNRDEILALLFTFLAFGQAIRFCATHQWWRIILIAIFFNIAMGSKITVFPFALLIPLSINYLIENKQSGKVIFLSLLLPLIASLWVETFSLRQQLVLVIASVVITFVSNFELVKLSWKNLIHFFLRTLGEESAPSVSHNGYAVSSVKDFFILVKDNASLLVMLFIFNIVIYFFPLQPTTMVLPMLLIGIFAVISKSENRLHFLLLYFSFYCWQILLIFSKYSSGISMFYGVFLAGIIGRFKLLNPIFFMVFLLPLAFSKAFLPMPVLIFWGVTYFLLESPRKVIRNIFIFFHLAMTLFAIVVAFIYRSESFDAKTLYNQIINLSIVFLPQLLQRISKKTYITTIIFLFAALTFLELRDAHFSQRIFSKELTINVQETARQLPAPKIVPTASYRPVLFAEFPIEGNPHPIDKKIGLSAAALLKYVQLTLFPYPLAFYYGYKELEALPIMSFQVILSILIHLLLLLALIYYYGSNKLIAFGIGFYLISIAPFSTLFYPIPGVVADRYLFAPTLGFAIGVVGVCASVFRINITSKNLGYTHLPPLVRYFFLAVLIIYALLSFLRNRDWKDRLTLFRKDIEHVENSAQAHNLLAFHLAMEAQRITSIPERNAMLQEATVHFKRATEIWPGFMNATYDLGRVLEQLGRWREAIDAYFRTYQIDSTFTDAIFRAGIVYENLPNIDSAIVCYEHVIKENPANTAAFNNLSYIYFRSKNYRKAIEISTQAYAANPQNTDPLVNIGKTFLNINQPDSAIFYFERAYPYRRGDAGLVQILYQLWKEKNSDSSKTQYYLGEMQRMGIAK